MRVAIATVQVPFITGGAEVLVRLLREQLVVRGHEAEIVSIPFKWYPTESLIDCMTMGRMMDLTETNGEKIDVVVAVKFPAYYLHHDHKVLWLCHQHRQAYDLWGTKFGDLHRLPEGDAVRQFIVNSDNRMIREARAVYTISINTSRRLMHFNGIASEPLYHPPAGHERLRCDGYGDFVFYPSRLDPMKRQRLLVEAARYLSTKTRVVLAGGGNVRESEELARMVRDQGVDDRVTLLGYVSEEEKIRLYNTCLAVYFGAFDEDYGYVPLEAMFAEKPVILHPDAGGPLEFIVDGEGGFVVPAEPQAIAARIDQLARERGLARAIGRRQLEALVEKEISWDRVIGRLLGAARG